MVKQHSDAGIFLEWRAIDPTGQLDPQIGMKWAQAA
jgi:hypothetical protein